MVRPWLGLLLWVLCATPVRAWCRLTPEDVREEVGRVALHCDYTEIRVEVPLLDWGLHFRLEPNDECEERTSGFVRVGVDRCPLMEMRLVRDEKGRLGSLIRGRFGEVRLNGSVVSFEARGRSLRIRAAREWTSTEVETGCDVKVGRKSRFDLHFRTESTKCPMDLVVPNALTVIPDYDQWTPSYQNDQYVFGVLFVSGFCLVVVLLAVAECIWDSMRYGVLVTVEDIQLARQALKYVNWMRQYAYPNVLDSLAGIEYIPSEVSAATSCPSSKRSSTQNTHSTTSAQ